MLSINKNWSSLIKPSKIVYDGNSSTSNANIIIEPLERGFGLTLGNALRRVLLSSLQGASITAVSIPGVEHEFSAKPGVKEDIVDIILNLKKISIKMNISEQKKVRIRAKGPCIVTANMIESDTDVEVLTPEQKICTLSKDTELEMLLYCNVGKGYVPAGNNMSHDLPIGAIAIDALYNPVKRVSYKVEDTRIGQVTDFDRLILNIETDGTISPEMALALSAKILQDQLDLFITFEAEEEEQDEVEDKLDYNPILLKKVDELELSVRSRNCLQNDNIVYIGDLVNKTEVEMLKTQNFGRKSLNEIKNVLLKLDLKFGMAIADWPPEDIEELAKKYEDPY
jgi:DNA-directed RNA polymerase subunit alpha